MNDTTQRKTAFAATLALAFAIALGGLAGAGCDKEDCNQKGCPTGLMCAAVCSDWSSGCAHYECVECSMDDHCDLGFICRDNQCRASYLDMQCSDLCSTSECALPAECDANSMTCTDYDFGEWGHCATPCAVNLDCPGPDDRSHWTRCLECPDQPSFCTYNAHRCPGEEGTTGPSGGTPCDYSGCMEVCVAAGGSNCGTDCSCD